MTLKQRDIIFIAAAMLLWPGFAQAHLVTTGLGPVYDGIGHFALSPDDILPVVAVALLAGLRGAASGRWALFVLPPAWFFGGLIGLRAQIEPHFPMACISFLVLGILVAADAPLPAGLIAMIAGAIAIVHGYLNGVAMSAAGASTTTGALQLIGIMVALFVIVAIFAAMVVSLRQPWTRIVVRVAGSWIAAMGLLYLGWSIAQMRRPLNHSVTLNRFNDSSLIVSPSPGTLSSRSMNPSFGLGSPSKMYQNNSLPTSTSTGGKNSAIGEFRLAITT
jgi:hydrogenase/urease accessory protein HupE